MSADDLLDIAKKLIVGRRGRGRAERLICYDGAGAQRTITVKAQASASRYLDLIAACHPIRIEAYAGKELVDAWESSEAQEVAAPVEAPAPAPRPTKASLRKKRSLDDRVITITSHMNGLLASAHRDHGKATAERDATVWKGIVDIAQTHSNLAANFETRALEAEKGNRIRDRAIRERDEIILRLNLKIAELTMSEGGDKNSDAFFKLLEVAGAGGGSLAAVASVARTVNGASSPAKDAATSPATTNGKAKPKEPAS